MKITLRLLVCLFCWITPAYGQALHRNIPGTIFRVVTAPIRACWHHKEECAQDGIVIASLWADAQTTWSAKKRCPDCVDRTFGKNFSQTHLFGVVVVAQGGAFVLVNRAMHGYVAKDWPTAHHIPWGFVAAIAIDKGAAVRENAGIPNHLKEARAKLAP